MHNLCCISASLTDVKKFECSPAAPWGIHPPVRNDEDCPRCGWTAPGPRSDARAASVRLAAAIAAEHGWAVIEGGASAAAGQEPETRAA
jgi:hypothetical protein